MCSKSQVESSETINTKESAQGGADLYGWTPEEDSFWQRTGKKIAFKNLWISVPCLLVAFAVWMYWSVITVQMLNLGFPYSKAELFTLSSIAGLSGATLRIPSTFLIRMSGGRNTIFFTTLLLILPALGTGLALQDPSTPLWVFQILALLSGFGGGNFASSMSNISFFFPKKMQGLSLGLNAGIGNFGVTTMQVLVPLAMTMGVSGQTSMILKNASGTLIGKIAAGTPTFIQNAAYIWVIALIPLVLLSWFMMNNIKDEHVSPETGSTLGALARAGGMLLIGLLSSALGAWAILPAKSGGLGLSQWLVLPAIVLLTVYTMKLLPGKIHGILQRQYKIFENKHTWVMTVIYTMTFGSFIGYAAAFPLAIQTIFGFCHIPGADGALTHNIVNPNAPSALTYAWMGAFVGALIRPVGGWIADKVGGALVTQIVSVLMVGAALGSAYYLNLAYHSPSPEQFFVPFFLLFLLLFLASGIGNGSTFRSVAYIFNKEQAGPVLGWTSAIAAYGAFIIPKVIGEQIEKGTPEYALYGFAAFYLICVLLNWWYYLRPGAEHKNP